jgi:hypothetical protein
VYEESVQVVLTFTLLKEQRQMASFSPLAGPLRFELTVIAFSVVAFFHGWAVTQ